MSDIIVLSDEELAFLIKTLSQRNANENGEIGEALGMRLACIWNARHPGVLPPHLQNRKLPKCFSNKFEQG